MKKYFYIISIVLLAGCSQFSMFNTNQPPIAQAPIQQNVVVKNNDLILAEKYTAIDAKVAFITEGNGEMYYCKVENNTLINCTTTGTDNYGRDLKWSPNAVDIIKKGGYNNLYVVGAENIYNCKIDDKYQLVGCNKIIATDTTNKPIDWLPLDIDFLTLNNQTYVYITGVTKVYKCVVTNVGFNGCSETGQAFGNEKVHWLPTNLNIEVVNNIPYAYVVSTNAVSKCVIDNDANLTNCDKTGIDYNRRDMSWHPNGITLYKVNESSIYAYVTDQSKVYKCVAKADGSLEFCDETGVNSSNQRLNWLPSSIAINKTMSNQLNAYIAGVYGLYSCNIDLFGRLTNCNSISAPKLSKARDWNPKGILLF